MKIFKLLVVVSLLTVGCATQDKVMLDSTPRTPTTQVDVYYPNKLPDKHYKEIAKMTYLGPLEEEAKAIRHFQSMGKPMGANAILYEGNPQGYNKSMGMWGNNGGGFGSSTAFVFKATAIVYTEH